MKEFFDNNAHMAETKAPDQGAYFDATAYGPYTIPEPITYVQDADETKSFNNILSKDETFKYNTYQTVPMEISSYYYSSFKMTNTLPDNVEYISAKVYDDSGTDVSSKFSITQNGNTITAIANDTSIESFYYTEYNLEITVKLKTDSFITEGQKEYNFSNKTTTAIVRNSKTITLNSNIVTSNYYEKDITVTKDWIDNNNLLSYRPQNIVINIKADGSDYDSVILDGSGNTWTKTLQVPKFNPDGSEIVYVAKESEIVLPNGDKYVPTETGLSIINTLTGEKELTITKVWKDNENAYLTRPDSLDIFVFQNNIKIDTLSLVSENAIDNSTWQIKKNYPKYDTNGKEYVYTIQEDENNLNLLYYYDPDKITYNQNTLTITNYGVWMVLGANDIPDNYKHTITIHKDIVGTTEAFERLMLSPDDTYIFPIVLKQMNLTYSKGETSMLENYEGFSGNIYTGYVTNKNDLIFTDIPAGKYEVSEETIQYFDFNGFSLSLTSQGASFTEENGKHYITISSLTKANEFITINSQSILDDLRPFNCSSSKENLIKPIKIIYFTIGQSTGPQPSQQEVFGEYKAKEGMTFGEWINTDYSKGYFIKRENDNRIYLASDLGFIIVGGIGEKLNKANEVIQDSCVYTLSND